jgi:hypothetical protein
LRGSSRQSLDGKDLTEQQRTKSLSAIVQLNQEKVCVLQSGTYLLRIETTALPSLNIAHDTRRCFFPDIQALDYQRRHKASAKYEKVSDAAKKTGWRIREKQTLTVSCDRQVIITSVEPRLLLKPLVS